MVSTFVNVEMWGLALCISTSGTRNKTSHKTVLSPLLSGVAPSHIELLTGLGGGALFVLEQDQLVFEICYQGEP